MVRLPALVLMLLVVTPLVGGAPADSRGAAPEPAPGEAREIRALAPPGLRPLPFFYDLYTFRGEGGATSVVASFAVPVGELDREVVEGEVRYRFNVTLVLADTARGGWARSDDSVFVALERPPDEEHLLHTWVETEARPSNTTVQRVIMINAPTPGTGQLYTHGFPIPDYSGSELMLSDIALGLPGPGGGWNRGGARLALLPSDHFPGGDFDVYYEIYNLPPDRAYTTEISIQAIDDSGAPLSGTDATVRVRFSGEAASGRNGRLNELRRVDGSLPEGRYRLTVHVTDEVAGRTARRSKILRVRDWDEGATLVAACPVAPTRLRPACEGRP